MASDPHEDNPPAATPHGTTRKVDADIHSHAALHPGDVVGQYTIREQLGEGGFAIVYLAEQTVPIERRVAIKIIKPGMDSHQIVARFRGELHALAMMDHPNIAKVLDAGTTERGRAYFVMEFLSGEPITTYCDRHKLSNNERLDLFTQTCDAIQHAHQKGVIHRDIKPTNVLVTVRNDQPRVKVIDFGVAKALGHRLSDETVFTAHGQLIGTPEYMSPEQAEMGVLEIDTRSDIYSLGVLLYELLVGDLPFDRQQLRAAAIGEIQRIIREIEPPKPSTRCSTMVEARLIDCATHRHTDPTSLRRELRGDLDWITMKALEKDRSHRYASASELAADIQRHVSSQPVLAGPPGAMYRARKFVRRHRIAVGISTIVLVLVGAGSTAFAWQRGKASAAIIRTEQLEDLLRDLMPLTAAYIELAAGYAEHRDTAAALTVYRDFESITRATQDVDPAVHAQLITSRVATIMQTLEATYNNSTPQMMRLLTEIRSKLHELEQLQAQQPVNVERSMKRLNEPRINETQDVDGNGQQQGEGEES